MRREYQILRSDIGVAAPGKLQVGPFIPVELSRGYPNLEIFIDLAQSAFPAARYCTFHDSSKRPAYAASGSSEPAFTLKIAKSP